MLDIVNLIQGDEYKKNWDDAVKSITITIQVSMTVIHN